MQYYIQCNNGLGTDNQAIIKDLKTIKGVINRIKKGYFKKGIWRIYSYTNIFCDESYKLVATYNK